MQMGMDELEGLKQQNVDRIKDIEQKYFQRKDEIKNVKEICQERAELREHREKKSDGLSYPTYGRGLDPNPNIDTYMINAHLCHDGSVTKKKTVNVGDASGSPAKKPKMKRPKIISPQRQKYETHFERYFVGKHLEKKLKEDIVARFTSGAATASEEVPAEVKKSDEKFDVVTKTVGSINIKAVARQKKSAEKFKQKLQKSKKPK